MSLKDRLAAMTGVTATRLDFVVAKALQGNETEGFDAAWYLRAYSDVKAAGVDPQVHYLRSGWKECRAPAANFDAVFYRSAVSGLTHPELSPLVHYNTLGRTVQAPRSRVEALEMGGNSPAASDLIAAMPELAAHFDAAGYSERYPDVIMENLGPLEHYLTQGWREGRNPSERFETVFYRETFQHNDSADICPLVHWLRYGRSAGLPTTADEARRRTVAMVETGKPDPSEALLASLDRETVAVLCAPHFDAQHYLRLYADVAEADFAPWWHYVSNGCQEGRRPNNLFDPDWYVGRYMAGTRPAPNPLLHYAVVGRMARRPASTGQTMVLMDRATDSAFGDLIRLLLGQLGFDMSRINGLLNFDRVRRFVLPLFSAAAYRRDRNLPAHVSDVDCFLRYLSLDFPAGHPPGPMFSTGHYLAEVRRKGITLPRSSEPPFHHWLLHGTEAGISPSPGFSEEDYLVLNPDLLGYPGSLFEHFIRYGQYEGRRFNQIAVTANGRLSAVVGDTSTAARRFCEAMAATVDEDGNLGQMRRFMTCGRLEATVREATALEPDVGGLDKAMLSFLPPWHDEAWVEYSCFLRLLPEGPFDSIVLMPFCKLGGADFVAGVLTTALSETGRVLVIRTDADDWERPDWFPADVATVDFSPLFGPMHPNTRMRILYELLLRIRPKAVYNVNSRLAFDTYVRFGERLALMMRLYAYYFCADRTPEGIEAGYPVWYFSNILAHLSGAMIDNAALARELIGRYSLTGTYRDRVSLVYTPSMSVIPETTIAEAQSGNGVSRNRKRVLWAGRLDTQKRFDLVQEIARLLPKVDFDCWGKAVLDAPPDLSSLPPNLKVHPPFKTYDELPLSNADGWLYTSGWDGMPTILIELAALGVPMVASAVGGVPELIDNTTGWPLDERATARDYADAIKEMIASPEQRVIRARALQDRVRSQHSREAYASAIAGMTAAQGKEA